MSSSLHTNEAVRVNFVRLGLETSVETSSSPFMEGIAPPHTQESGWTGLSPSRESPRFVAPTWECPGASPAQDSSDTQLQEAVQKQIEVLLRGAEREAQHIKEEAYAAGFATGEEQGFEAGARLMSFLDGIETMTFEEDETVPPGSCVVETPMEIVDLRWEEQLEELAASLFETYEREQRGNHE